jgi:hypothetical protein
MVNGADCPGLHVFASWPEEAKLGWTLEWNGKLGEIRMSEDGSEPDQHSLVTLNLAGFHKEFAWNWFLGYVRQSVVSSKHSLGEQNSRVASSAETLRVWGVIQVANLHDYQSNLLRQSPSTSTTCIL